jgi:uncharacterized Ntn-hydrolase superfamily protein
LGVAVQSKFLAVGSVVPWARAGVGAVATQAMANFNYGPRGLDLMAKGRTAEETVEALTSADEGRATGSSASWTRAAGRRRSRAPSASTGPAA